MNTLENTTKSNKNNESGFLDRQVIYSTKRHSFGLFTIYGLMIIAISLIFVFFWLAGGILGSIAIIVICVVFAAIIFHLVHKIYTSNELIISNLDIHQNIRTALFAHKFSALNLIDVEDVTYTKSGVFSNMFDYGTLHIETAGEQTNFYFIYCPNPEKVRQVIFDARVQYIKDSAKVNID